MTTQELHIELDLLLQKVNNHWNQSFLPAEKDLFLNREITRFINRRIDRLSNKKQTGLYDTIKRTVELSPLLRTAKIPVIYNIEQKEVKILLPFDFLEYISSEISVCCSCKNLELKTGNYYIAELPPIKNINSLPLIVKQGLYSLTIDNTDIPSDYLIESSIPAYTNEMMITNALSILFKQKNNLEVEIKYNKEKRVFVLRSLKPFEVLYNKGSVDVKAVKHNNYVISDNVMSSVDIIDEEFKSDIKRSYLSGAKPDKALGVFRKDEMLYTLNGVIADYVNLTYLCKPAKIDLLLQSNSDLSDTTLEKIVADTAQRIMGVLGTDNYAKFVEENTLLE